MNLEIIDWEDNDGEDCYWFGFVGMHGGINENGMEEIIYPEDPDGYDKFTGKMEEFGAISEGQGMFFTRKRHAQEALDWIIENHGEKFEKLTEEDLENYSV